MKTVLITGCSNGGIGQTLAEQFAKAGCHVYATSRKKESMSALEPIKTITLLELDVCDKTSIEKCRSFVESETGGSLDILVNNAGISYTCASVEMNLDTCREIYETNVFAVMQMNKQFSQMLIRAKGTIVNTGSVAGIIPTPFGGVYHSTKAALHSYLDCLRLELEPFDVKVVTVITGGVQSNIAANAESRFSLQDDSIYKPVEASMRQRMTTSQAEGTCSRTEYASSVVTQVLQPNPPPRIWKGKFSFMIWVLNSFTPYWLIARLMANRFGLHTYKSLLNRE